MQLEEVAKAMKELGHPTRLFIFKHLVKAGVDQDGVKDQVHDRVNHGQNLFTPDAHIVEDQGQRNHAAVSGS